MLNTTSLWEIQIKTTMSYHYIPIRIGKIMRLTIPSVGKDVKWLDRSYAAGGGVGNGTITLENCLLVSGKLNHKIQSTPRCLLQRNQSICPFKDLCVHTHTHTYSCVHSSLILCTYIHSSLIYNSPKLEIPQMSTQWGWINKLSYVHSMDKPYISSNKKGINY